MGLFKRKNIPPDVGDEEEEETPEEIQEESEGNEDSVSSNFPPPAKETVSQNGSQAGASNVNIEEIKARLNQLQSFMQGYSERFSQLNQQLGEVRNMSLSNEKLISKSNQQVEKAVGMVEEVQPQELGMQYQKLNQKLNLLGEKIAAEREFKNVVMKELSDLRKNSEAFMGTEALLGLNEEVKGDLLNVQKTVSEVRAHSSKVEEIFAELRKRYVKIEKLNETVTSLNSFYTELKERLEKLRVNYGEIVSQDDFEEFKDSINKKFVRIENFFSSVKSMEEKNEEMVVLIEKTLSIAKRNKANIENIAVTIGNERIQKVSNIENRIASMLDLIDDLAGKVSELREKNGLKNNENSSNKISKGVKESSNKNYIPTDNFQLNSNHEENINSNSSQTKNIENNGDTFNNDNRNSVRESRLREELEKIDKLVQKGNLQEANEIYYSLGYLYNPLPVERKKVIYPELKRIFEKITPRN